MGRAGDCYDAKVELGISELNSADHEDDTQNDHGDKDQGTTSRTNKVHTGHVKTRVIRPEQLQKPEPELAPEGPLKGGINPWMDKTE